jgi:hypothetical protein
MNFLEKDELMTGFKKLEDLVSFGLNEFDVSIDYLAEHYWTDDDGNEWYSCTFDEEVGAWGKPKDIIKNAEERGYGSYFGGYEDIVHTGTYAGGIITYCYAIYYEPTYGEPYNEDYYEYHEEPRIIRKKGE